jgi:methylthioribose-1-phosphate isomerase
MLTPIQWTDGGVVMLDQLQLPTREVHVTLTTYEQVADAIRRMVIRGAPAIGVAAAMGIALGVKNSEAKDPAALEKEFGHICDTMAKTRPTAVNLFWAIQQMRRTFTESAASGDITQVKSALVEEARRIHADDIARCQAIGPGGYGTVLGVVRAAVADGKNVRVLAPETRPYLQGARLTTWELQKDGIPTTLITDNMVGHILKTEKVDCVIVGADRIAANGDTANKIGTYTMGVMAREHGVPFYVAAPFSSIDLPSPPVTRSQSKSAPPKRSSASATPASPLRTSLRAIRPSTSPRPGSSPPSSPSVASLAHPLNKR